MNEISKIVSFVAEEEDSDWKDTVHPDQWTEGNSWLRSALSPLGFKYRDMGCRGWEKSTGSKMVSVGTSTNPEKAYLNLYYKTGTGRWQHDTSFSVEYGGAVLDKLREWGFIR